jgi:hypothetical protein
MKRSLLKKSVLAALAVIVGGGVVSAIWLGSEPEPRFEEKSLTHWLELSANMGSSFTGPDGVAAETRRAVRAIGSPAIPALLKMLRYHESGFRRFVSRREFTGRLGLKPAVRIQREALIGFASLGPAASNAIPDLIEMLPDRELGVSAARALAWIGPEALPPLEIVLQQGTPEARWRSTQAIGLIPSEKIPEALFERLKDTDARVRAAATSGLSAGARQPERMVPTLIAMLSDLDPHVRAAAVTGLKGFGPPAKEALPALQQLEDDPSTFVKALARSAIRSITIQE